MRGQSSTYTRQRGRTEADRPVNLTQLNLQPATLAQPFTGALVRGQRALHTGWRVYNANNTDRTSDACGTKQRPKDGNHPDLTALTESRSTSSGLTTWR